MEKVRVETCGLEVISLWSVDTPVYGCVYLPDVVVDRGLSLTGRRVDRGGREGDGGGGRGVARKVWRRVLEVRGSDPSTGRVRVPYWSGG